MAMRAYRSIAALVVALPLAAQHGRYLNDSQHPFIGKPEAIAEGSKLFSASCGGCHGPDGSGGRGPNLVRRALWHPLGDEAIFQVIRKGVPGADMPPTNLTDDQTWSVVAFIHALTGPAVDQKVAGDPAAGQRVFANAGCASCHAIRGAGGRLAPDLSNIGGSQPLGVIRESILEPSKDLFYLGNEGIALTLKDGRKTTHACDSHEGDFNRPFAESVLRGKFRMLAGHVLKPEGVAQVEQAVDRCEEWNSVTDFTAILRIE